MSRVHQAMTKADATRAHGMGIRLMDPERGLHEKVALMEEEARQMHERFAFAVIVAACEGTALIGLALWWWLA